jgi:hypothetical protein
MVCRNMHMESGESVFVLILKVLEQLQVFADFSQPEVGA